ncbi:MAG: transglutaminase TgpA family protein, partial [Planctomycetota bacterium]
TEGPRARALPGWLGTVLIAVIAVNAGLDFLVRDAGWERSLAHFALWLTVLRLYQRKGAREYAQLMVLSLVLMLLGTLQTTSLLFGAVLLVYAVLGLHALMLLQLYAGQERFRAERRADAPAGYRLVPPAKGAVGRHATGQLRLLAGAIVVSGLALGASVFALFPRGLGQSMLPAGRMAARARPGPPATVDLGSNLRLSDSRRMVLTVTPLDDAGRPVRLEPPLRLRAGTLNIYQRDRRWRSTASQMRSVPTIPDRWTPLGEVAAAPDGRLILLVHPARRMNVLFTMTVPMAIRTADAEMIAFNPGTYRTLRDRSRLEPYRVAVDRAATTASLERLAGGLDVAVDPTILLDGLRDPEVAALARTVLEDASLWPPPADDADGVERWRVEAATALCGFLHDGPFRYTLDPTVIDPPDTERGDPIRRFLLETGAGHCEHFASALAALCWNVDIPARLVAGYLAYVAAGDGGSVLVLESNAHAWTEVLATPLRWVELDPTPPATRRRMHDIRPTLADRLSWIYQRLEGSWDAAVIAYDDEAQHRLAERIDRRWSARARRMAAALSGWVDRVNRAFYFGPAGSVWLGLVAFAVFLAVLVIVRTARRSARLQRRLRLHRVPGPQLRRMRRELGFYVDMLDALRAAGAAKPDWMPPGQHAARLRHTRPSLAEPALQLTELYYAGRYGGRALTPGQLDRIDELLGQIRDRRSRRDDRRTADQG